jgi:L-lactate dehydrogenase (cytochrome)/(S)-mandelate dehydrogenase
MGVEKAVNIEDLRRMARRRLPKLAWDFLENGAEDEIGMARNIAALARHCLLPRYLVDVTGRSQKTELFGRTYASPFGFGATGTAGLFRRGAEQMLAATARDVDLPYVMSGAANASIEDIARIAPDRTWYQIYAALDHEITHDQIARARDAGFPGLVVTVDVPTRAKREKNIRNGFNQSQRMKPLLLLEALTHPGWIAEFVINGGRPTLGTWERYTGTEGRPDDAVALFTKLVPAADQTWEDLRAYRGMWPGQLIVKGILHPEDARLAVDAGADGIIVSNHGGRQLDRAPAAIDMLPAVVEAVGGRASVMFDSGVRRGADILVALCLGADFTFIGRAGLYGVAAGGLEGARRACDILAGEIDLALGQIGCPDVADLGPQWLWREGPVSRP